MPLLPSDPKVLQLKEKYNNKELNKTMNAIYEAFEKNPKEYSMTIGEFFISPLSIAAKIEKNRLQKQNKDVSSIPNIEVPKFRMVIVMLASIIFKYIFLSGIFTSSMRAAQKGYVYLGLLSGMNLFMKGMSENKLIYYFDDKYNVWLHGGPVFFDNILFIKQCMGHALKNATNEKEKEFIKTFIDMPFDKQELYIRGFLDMLFSYFEFKDEPVILQIENK